MDQLLVCPNNIAKDQGFEGFKIKVIFTEACEDANCASRNKNSMIGSTFQQINENEEQEKSLDPS